MNFEKANLKAKYAGTDTDKPKYRIKQVSNQGLIHIDFTNKMKLQQLPKDTQNRQLEA